MTLTIIRIPCKHAINLTTIVYSQQTFPQHNAPCDNTNKKIHNKYFQTYCFQNKNKSLTAARYIHTMQKTTTQYKVPLHDKVRVVHTPVRGTG